MQAVTLSPKFQVVIPRKVRQELKLKPGQKFQIIAYNNQIRLVPLEPIKNLRGRFKGIDTIIEREPDRV